MSELRPYQKDACNFAVDQFERSSDPALIVLPTGAGKTQIFSAIAKYWVLCDPAARVVVLAHRAELIKQAASRLRSMVPAGVGMWCGSLGLKQAEQVTVATIQSMADFPMEPDLVIVDECHRIPHGEEGQYHDLLAKMPPHAKLLGVTATPYRLGGGEIVGPDHLFPRITFRVDMMELIKGGYLVEPKLFGADSALRINTEGLRVTAGDYNQRDLEERVADLDLIQRQVYNALPRLAGRQKVIWFCVDIAHAEAVAAHLPDATVVHSKLTQHQRETALQGFHLGLFRHLVNVSVTTEGYDEPAIDAVVLLRPTQSPVFYVQSVGRGLRTLPGIGELPTAEERLAAIAASVKPDCLVLDYAGVVENLGPVNDPAIKVKKSGKGDAGDPPLKICDECMEYVPVAAKVCPGCGLAFPEKDDTPISLTQAGGVHRILDSGEPFELAVMSASFGEYVSMNSGRRCLLIEYRHGIMSTTPEYLTFDSPFPLKKAREILSELGMSDVNEINTVDDALARTDELWVPKTITVKKDGKYMRVVKRSIWGAPEAAGA